MTTNKLITTEAAQAVRLKLVETFMKIEGFIELGVETQLSIIDQYYNFVVKGETKNDDTGNS